MDKEKLTEDIMFLITQLDAMPNDLIEKDVVKLMLLSIIREVHNVT